MPENKKNKKFIKLYFPKAKICAIIPLYIRIGGFFL